MSDIKTIIFLGLPGSGKGTQTKLLADHLGWGVFSSGEKFRQLSSDEGPLSERVRREYEAGKLSPDWLAAYFFEKAILDLTTETGLVCEGFPRSLAQAQLATDIFAWLGRPYKVLYLRVSEESALDRQLGRGKVENRSDSDSVEKIQARFEVYRAQTEPLVQFFKEKGTLVEIDGEQTPEEIAENIRKVLGV